MTGFPAELRQPKPLPGETLFQLVIQNHQQEWRNFKERLTREHTVDPALIAAIEHGRAHESRDAAVNAELDRFLNFRLPSHGRTISTLSRLREQTESEVMRELGGARIVEILWPREKHPAGDESTERMAASFGAKIIPFESGASRELSLELVLQHVHGDCLWLAPGGTRVMPGLAVLELERIARLFSTQPRCALYVDAMPSVVYRVSALKDLIRRRIPLRANVQEMARSLDTAGYTFAVDKDPDHVLCELEPEYGGPRRKSRPSRERTPWWKRLFGG